jgi:hypothetical protein
MLLNQCLQSGSTSAALIGEFGSRAAISVAALPTAGLGVDSGLSTAAARTVSPQAWHQPIPKKVAAMPPVISEGEFSCLKTLA